MPVIDKPIEQRRGYQQLDQDQPDALQRDLGAIAKKHGLIGCVLVQLTKDRFGVRSWAVNDEICRAMDTLGTRILTDIDDGRHDPLESLPSEGNG